MGMYFLIKKSGQPLGIMKKITAIATLITVSFLLTGCFSTITDDDLTTVDPLISEYVNDLKKEYLIRGFNSPTSVTVILSDDNMGNHKGEYHNGKIKLSRQFVIDRLSAKTKEDSAFLKLVVWHELGHSTGKKHRDGLSIMNSGDWFENKGDFIKTVQTFNEHPYSQKSIIDEFFK